MGFKVKDHYFDKAKKENYMARSVYKLEEIDQKFKVIEKDDIVLDLGYHPGSWMQYSSAKVGKNGFVVGIDIRELNYALNPLQNVRIYKKDINDVKDLAELGLDKKVDVVVSDMAPNTTGIKSVDQIRRLQLVEMVFYHLPQFLKPGGNFVIKVFDGHETQQFLKEQRKSFEKFQFLKPKSTRSVSKEFFVIGLGYKNV